MYPITTLAAFLMTQAVALAANDAVDCHTADPFRESQKTYDACNRAILASEEKDKAKATLLAQRGEAYYWVDHIVEAIGDFNSALTLDPDLNDTRIQRGWARMRTGNPAGAYSDFTDALERNPKSGRALYALGFMERNPDRKRKIIEQAIALTPDYYLAHDALAEIDNQSSATRDLAIKRLDFLINQGEVKLNSVRYLYRFGKLNTKNYHDSVLLNRGDMLYTLGRYEEAMRDYQKLAKRYSGHPTPYVKQATVLMRLDRINDALAMAQKSHDVCVENGYSHLCGESIEMIMEPNLHLGHFENVIKLRDEVENQRNSDNLRATMSIQVAQAYKSLGKIDEARAAFVRTGQLDPFVLSLISDPMMKLGYYEGFWEGKIDENFFNGLEACLLDATCKVNI